MMTHRPQPRNPDIIDRKARALHQQVDALVCEVERVRRQLLELQKIATNSEAGGVHAPR